MRAVALLALLASLPACTPILGDYKLGEPAPEGPCRQETEDEDCPPGYGCQGARCALRCSSDGQCGSFSRCSSNLCTVKLGTACKPDDYAACEPLSCETLDVNGQKVDGYCTEDPYNYPGKTCPPGMTSTDEFEECRKL